MWQWLIVIWYSTQFQYQAWITFQNLSSQRKLKQNETLQNLLVNFDFYYFIQLDAKANWKLQCQIKHFNHVQRILKAKPDREPNKRFDIRHHHAIELVGSERNFWVFHGDGNRQRNDLHDSHKVAFEHAPFHGETKEEERGLDNRFKRIARKRPEKHAAPSIQLPRLHNHHLYPKVDRRVEFNVWFNVAELNLQCQYLRGA